MKDNNQTTIASAVETAFKQAANQQRTRTSGQDAITTPEGELMLAHAMTLPYATDLTDYHLMVASEALPAGEADRGLARQELRRQARAALRRAGFHPVPSNVALKSFVMAGKQTNRQVWVKMPQAELDMLVAELVANKDSRPKRLPMYQVLTLALEQLQIAAGLIAETDKVGSEVAETEARATRQLADAEVFAKQEEAFQAFRDKVELLGLNGESHLGLMPESYSVSTFYNYGHAYQRWADHCVEEDIADPLEAMFDERKLTGWYQHLYLTMDYSPSYLRAIHMALRLVARHLRREHELPGLPEAILEEARKAQLPQAS